MPRANTLKIHRSISSGCQNSAGKAASNGLAIMIHNYIRDMYTPFQYFRTNELHKIKKVIKIHQKIRRILSYWNNIN